MLDFLLVWLLFYKIIFLMHFVFYEISVLDNMNLLSIFHEMKFAFYISYSLKNTFTFFYSLKKKKTLSLFILSENLLSLFIFSEKPLPLFIFSEMSQNHSDIHQRKGITGGKPNWISGIYYCKAKCCHYFTCLHCFKSMINDHILLTKYQIPI